MKIIPFIILAITFSCGTSSFETEGGTPVKYFKQGDGELPVDSLVGLYCIRYTTAEGAVIRESDFDNPLPLKIDPNNYSQQGELYEVLSKLRIGDSVGFELVAKELFERTFRGATPDSIPEESMLKFQISYIDQLSEAGYYEWIEEKNRKKSEKQLTIDLEILDDYLAENEINATKTESGLRYVISEQGNGPLPDSGQVVKVNYAGWVLNGEYFDTSIESVAREQGLYQEGRPYQPFSFALGARRVIKGWDEGIAYLNKGSKATLYIPSPLGYGTRGSGQIIRPNSILVFDVELVDIE